MGAGNAPLDVVVVGVGYWGPTWCGTSEALQAMVTEFAACVRQGRTPRTDGSSALRVLSVMEATARSLAQHGALVDVDEDQVEGAR